MDRGYADAEVIYSAHEELRASREALRLAEIKPLGIRDSELLGLLKTVMQNSSSKHYLSFSKSLGRQLSGRAHVLSISIVFEQGCAAEWNGARITIVGQESVLRQGVGRSAVDLQITDCTVSPRPQSEPSESPPRMIRSEQPWRSLTQWPDRDPRCRNSTTSSGFGEPFSIVLKAEDVTGTGLTLSPFLGHDDDDDSDCTPPRPEPIVVLYDRVYQLANSSGSSTLFLNLESTIPVVAYPEQCTLYVQQSLLLQSTGLVLAAHHEVRIFPLPLPSRRKNKNNLPSEVVRRIATFMVQDVYQPEFGWRQQLLRMGLISRVWNPVLDLYFTTQPSSYKGTPDNGSLLALSNCLRLRPERGSLIKSFSLETFSDGSKPDIQVLTKANFVLSVATQLTSIELHVVPPSLYQVYIECLSKLRHIKICTVPLTGNRAFSALPVQTDDVLGLLSKWASLTSLRLTGEALPEDQAIEATLPINLRARNTEEKIRQVACNLKALSFNQYRLSGDQLFGFLNSFQGCPRLSFLFLQTVKGPTNKDLLRVLQHVRSTLSTLLITYCQFPKSSSDEEYALDASIGRLESLQELHIIQCDCISWKSIAQKPPHNNTDCVCDLHYQGPSLGVIAGIAESLETTGWNTIQIHTTGAQVDPVIHDRANMVAAKRKIIFSWSYEWN